MASPGWDRLRSTSGLVSLICAITVFAGGWLIAGNPVGLFEHPHYGALILVMVGWLDFFGLVGLMPLTWVVSAGFLLVVMDPTLAAVMGKSTGGRARLGFVMALLSDLISFFVCSPISESTSMAETGDRGMDKFIFTIGMFTFLGELLIWTRGTVHAQALWLILVYWTSLVSGFVPGRAFVVFASTVFAPRFLAFGLQSTGMMQVGMMVCAVTLGAVVVHFLYRRYHVDDTQPLGWNFWNLQRYVQSGRAFCELTFFILSLTGAIMVWVAAADRTPEVIASGLLLMATAMNHVSREMHFSRLVIAAFALIYSVTDYSAELARQATLRSNDILFTGWVLLLLGSIGSTVAALPVEFSHPPSNIRRATIVSIVLGVTLITGCVAVWADYRVYNNVLSLGLLGVFLMFAGPYLYLQGVEAVFHASILLVATYTPATLVVFPWIALLILIMGFLPPTTEVPEQYGNVEAPSGADVVTGGQGAAGRFSGEAYDPSVGGGIWSPNGAA